MKSKYFPPTFESSAFHCPSCGVYAEQHWLEIYRQDFNRSDQSSLATELNYSECCHCDKLALWFREKLIDPESPSAETAHPDLPEEIAADFSEARSIASRSPRSAAALLRLCIQKLCKELGGSGKHIDSDIKLLVSHGLPVKIQQALDIVRVIGNEQVHPGVLDVRDNPDLVAELFVLINLVVENQITQPKAVDDLYKLLPSTKRQAIVDRDAKSKDVDI